MQRQLLLFCFLFLFLTEGKSQLTKYVVFFSDKKGSPFTLTNPTAYLSSRAVERRTKYSIAIDSTDLPVLSGYTDSIVKAGTVSLLGRSKWLNAVIIQTNDANAITKINSFAFVKSVSGVALRKSNTAAPDKFSQQTITQVPFNSNKNQQLLSDTFNYGSSVSQIKIHKGEFLHNIGARGQGMVIAFLDAGFFGYTTNQFFDSARKRNQILATWDFVQSNASVYEDNAHGMQSFSTIAAFKPGTFVGSSPEANYYLLRTEDVASEQIIEEYNWAMGAEYADSAGVDVITSSLGYTTFDNAAFNHTYTDLDGNTTVISRIADLAAKKGMLIVNSAGNDGDKTWKYISAPADGDSVLSVGAVNGSGVIAAFSSFGPTSDRQIKPDVVSVGQGTAISTTSGTVGSGNGTSFSGPNMAGLATCLWQLFPEFNNWKIITTLRKSSDRFNTPQAQYGYGLPDMKKAVGILITETATMNTSFSNCSASISWSSKDIKSMRYIVERKLPDETVYTKIKTVEAKGQTFSNQTYQLTDMVNSSSAGVIIYRIKEVIDSSATGFEEYTIDSNAVTISAPCSTVPEGQKIKLYPNPVQSKLTIAFAEQEMINGLTIQIYNLQGQLVQTQNYNKPTGELIHEIPVAGLAKGTYVVMLLQGGKQYAVKEFVKQ